MLEMLKIFPVQNVQRPFENKPILVNILGQMMVISQKFMIIKIPPCVEKQSQSYKTTLPSGQIVNFSGISNKSPFGSSKQ